MGVAIAGEAASRGHDVTLLLGRGATATPEPGPALLAFDSTDELAGLLAEHFPQCDLLIMAAAVSDFLPKQTAPGKLDRRAGPWPLIPASDLVAGLAGGRRAGQRIVGFALEEPALLEARARAKLLRKGLDAIVANPLATMESASVSGMLIEADGSLHTAPSEATKPLFARWLLDALQL